MSEECIFCSIEEIQPELVVWATPDVVAFFDLNPLVVSEAHLLVVPRRHYERLSDVPPRDAEALGRALPVVARAVLDATGATDFNVVQNNGPAAGQVVNHVHFHIVVRGSAASALSIDPELVQRVRSHYHLRDRVAYAATVFGKGQRTGLGDIAGVAAALRKRLGKL